MKTYDDILSELSFENIRDFKFQFDLLNIFQFSLFIFDCKVVKLALDFFPLSFSHWRNQPKVISLHACLEWGRR